MSVSLKMSLNLSFCAAGDPMTGGKGAGTSLFIRHLRMNRALGIKSSTRQMPGRDLFGAKRCFPPSEISVLLDLFIVKTLCHMFICESGWEHKLFIDAVCGQGVKLQALIACPSK